MATNITIQKNVRIDWAPLAPTTTIEVVGAVPVRQDYCVDNGIYTPDYTLVGLTLQPKVRITCADGSCASGLANARMDDMKWYVVENGAETRILSTDADFDMSGGAVGTANAGRIVVKRNSNPNTPMALKFTAILYDDRLAQTIDVEASIAIRCTSSSAPPRLSLDCPRNTTYNPVRDADTQVIRAHLLLGGTPVPTAKRLFSWEVYDSVLGAAQWRRIGTDVLDYWAAIDDSQLIINRKLMRQGQNLRCRAAYDFGGSPSLADLADASPTVEFSVKRVLRGISAKVSLGRMATSDTTGMQAKVVINDNKGDFASATEKALMNQTFAIKWQTATNSQNLANPTYSTVASGLEATIPTSAMSDRYGMQVECSVEDLGPLMPWADSDGKILTDSDGAILLIK